MTCWGSNYFGQLNIPVNGAGTWVDLIVGGIDTCGLRSDNTLACWGNNGYGQSTVSDPSSTWVKIDTLSMFTCGMHSIPSDIECWGNNQYGQLNVPGHSDWTDFSVGSDHGCGIRSNGTMECWGFAGSGATTVPNDNGNAYTDWVALAVGGPFHTCGLHSDGTLECWGANPHGQLNIPESVVNCVEE